MKVKRMEDFSVVESVKQEEKSIELVVLDGKINNWVSLFGAVQKRQRRKLQKLFKNRHFPVHGGEMQRQISKVAELQSQLWMKT